MKIVDDPTPSRIELLGPAVGMGFDRFGDNLIDAIRLGPTRARVVDVDEPFV